VAVATDELARRRQARPAPAPVRRQLLHGWGRTAGTVADVVAPTTDEQVAEAVLRRPPRGVVARGLGRSYGDAAQNAGGTVLDLRGLDRVLDVDLPGARVTVEAGVSLDALMHLLLPLGLFVPVTPGTRSVTVGGAVAADVHGKDHHVSGSFCDAVERLDLLLADGTVRTVGPDRDPDLFWATAGGMGLTGVVLRATLRMRRVETSRVVVDTERADDLDDLLARLAAGDGAHPWSVAWVDCLARGRRLGRAVLTQGRPALRDELDVADRRAPLAFRSRPRLQVPDVLPSGLVNRATVAALNEAWFRRAPRERRGEVQGIAPFFHPLDGLGQWSRAYGPRGLVQHQFVVPLSADATVRRCVEALHDGGAVPSLAVLKRFGPGNPGPLSFPAPGWTLAVDVPVTAGTGAVLRRLDELVLAAGGRVYLAKDARTAPDVLAAMYPRLGAWRAVRDRVDPGRLFTSDLARRLAL
jgi:decaprenylphospho-beta-D-ribofuranose 2-oxidase